MSLDPPAKVFVVDDNAVVRRMLERMLHDDGIQVLTAKGGEELLKRLPDSGVELVLLDVEMPGIDGFETCRRLRADSRFRGLPVLFVTSRGEKTDILTGFAAGGLDYLVKPCIREELLARVHTHLSLVRARERLSRSEARYRELALRDDLTGFFNTRYLYQVLPALLEAHQRRGARLGIIFLDIDNFKRVVDAYGHLNGSRVIAELAALIQRLLPPDCFGVSYGGDEFVMVLPDHDRKQSVAMAETIRLATAANVFLASQDQEVHLTVSQGLATWPTDADNLTDLLANADHALFCVKKMGKNAVHWVEPA
ncbi:MAG: hypothetical protein BWK76_18885 [Desulfobulbaceae bacterium A2]|nr:MAG: hypothetical protein BWK76_18885 [Desulfobulbaceae bacterium A2]